MTATAKKNTTKPAAPKPPARRPQPRKRAAKADPLSPDDLKAYELEAIARRSIDRGLYEVFSMLTEHFASGGPVVRYGELEAQIRAAADLVRGIGLLTQLNAPTRAAFLARMVEADRE